MPPRFVFWDCDNTLIENADLHWRKHQVVLAHHGFTLPESTRPIFYHNNGNQNWHWLVDNLGLNISCQDYLLEIDTWYHAHIHELPLRPGVAWALDYFRQNNYKQCVVTNARRSSVEPMLDVQKIAPYFEFTWCKEDYANRKPDPTPYLSAIDKMAELVGHAIAKEDCLAIEDDPYGVTAAHKAGITVIQRRLVRDEAPSPDATLSLYDEDDFVNALKAL